VNEAICFVQFLHPGHEPTVPANGEVPWNTKGAHKRKFLRLPGAYLGAKARLMEDELVFWGEWEPPSHAVRLDKTEPLGPHWLQTPFRERRDGWAQNTDPFVFGSFRYSICQQHQPDGRPTQLAHLLPGSLILFGSGLSKGFRLDTVFVVAGVAATHDKHKQPHVDRDYEEVVMRPYYAEYLDDRVHSLYHGATPEDSVAGMFSFFPCKTLAEAPNGFARPTIRLPKITQRQTQKYRRTLLSSPDEASELWRKVVRQVEAQGCRLGVNAEMPVLRKSTGPAQAVAAGSC
jgi:hypothetical protein